MKIKIHWPILFVLVLVSQAHSQVVINEVFYDPAGDNTGQQLVELKNVSTDSVTLEGWWLCARQDYAQIPTVTLAPNAFLVVHVGASGNNSTTEVFLSSMLTLQNVSDLALYLDANFPNSGSVVDFVQWGGVPPVGRETEAVTAGQWTAGEFVAVVAEGHSVEYDGSGDGASDWNEQPNPTIGFQNTVTAVAQGGAQSPETFQLFQNFPNPFNPSTEIRFSLTGPGDTRLTIYNQLGQEVAVLVDDFLPAGTYRLEFNAENLPSGVFVYRLQTKEFQSSRKMILLR